MKIKKMARMLLSSMILISLLGTSGLMAKEGNARKGKYLFRKYCRQCHQEEATGDRVGKPLSPISKTQAEWDNVFKNYKSLGCADEWAKRKEKDIKDIYAHLWGHAFDSPSPAKCE
jgi:cytochrome c2